jgi:2-dehydro-3-deoxygalactonokinase
MSDSNPILVGCDWGTTNRTAFLIASTGAVLATRHDSMGLRSVRRPFAESFMELVAPWWERFGALPALLSGMVGARGGWREAGYCPVPSGIAELSKTLAAVDHTSPVWIVPGLRGTDSHGLPDVIRGEEVQALALAMDAISPAIVIVPGTHSKWIEVQPGRISRFHTYMTGDLYRAVLVNTIIATLKTGEASSPNAFAEGVERGAAEPAQLMHALFSARTQVLFGTMHETEVASYVSGMLIGAELAAALDIFPAASRPVYVFGSGGVAELYRQALALRGLTAEQIEPNAVGRVYLTIAELGRCLPAGG